LDEYHPKATRTLYVGNLAREVSANDLHEKFAAFGEILEIDVKVSMLLKSSLSSSLTLLQK
jgi:RNA recognition motif-containing protein